MIKALLKILKYVGFTLIGLIAVGAVLFVFGLRVVLDGGGSPHLRFVKSLDAQAKEIAQHRETQRAVAPAPAPEPLPASTGSGPATADKPVSAPAATVPAASAARDPGTSVLDGFSWASARRPLS